jgi:hypothetical protein
MIDCSQGEHPLRMHGLRAAERPDVHGPNPRVAERRLAEFPAQGEHASGAGEAADASGDG